MCSSLRGPSVRGAEAGAPDAALGAVPVAACRAHGCGCPHEDVAASCCCAGGARPEPVARASRVPADARGVTVVARERELPAATLDSFHCSGGKHGQATVKTNVTPAAVNRQASPGSPDAEHSWQTKNEAGPPFDLRTEPGTPPPRRARESELG